jgi:hypothetical protein
MTKSECKRILENLPAIQAFVESKPIEVDTRLENDWRTVGSANPAFESEHLLFRVKSDPRSWWAHSAGLGELVLMPDERCYHSCIKNCVPFLVQEVKQDKAPGK